MMNDQHARGHILAAASVPILGTAQNEQTRRPAVSDRYRAPYASLEDRVTTELRLPASFPAISRSRLKSVAFWIVTLIVAWEMVAGALWDLLQIEYVQVILDHLRYPLYISAIIGPWKLPCALALLVPRFPRLKEWAYAGAFFNYYGAAASHYLVGDPPLVVLGPLGYLAFTLASWALRPPDRRVPPAQATGSPHAVAWIVPVAVFAGLVVAAFVSLPVGPPPAWVAPWLYGSE
jgi:hypothetical protein